MAENEPQHEMRDASARIPLVTIVFMAIFVPLGLGLVWVLTVTVWAPPAPIDDPFAGDPGMTTPVANDSGVTTPVESPAPPLQPSPQADLAEFDARMTHAMTHYGWVDRDAGTVRLPIDRAMALLVERGLPSTQGPVPDRRLSPNPAPDAATRWVAPPPAADEEPTP